MKAVILNGSPRKNWNTCKMCECFDKTHKQKRKEEQFPLELEKAFNLGKNFV